MKKLLGIFLGIILMTGGVAASIAFAQFNPGRAFIFSPSQNTPFVLAATSSNSKHPAQLKLTCSQKKDENPPPKDYPLPVTNEDFLKLWNNNEDVYFCPGS